MAEKGRNKKNAGSIVITGFVLICFGLLTIDAIINFKAPGKTRNGNPAVVTLADPQTLSDSEKATDKSGKSAVKESESEELEQLIQDYFEGDTRG